MILRNATTGNKVSVDKTDLTAIQVMTYLQNKPNNGIVINGILYVRSYGRPLIASDDKESVYFIEEKECSTCI